MDRLTVSPFALRRSWSFSRLYTVLTLASSALIAAGCAPSIHQAISAFKSTTSSLSKTIGPDHLEFSIEPADSLANVSMPVLTVSFINSAGQVDTLTNAAVTLVIANNPAAGTLSGTTSLNAVDGVATFSDLSIDLGGIGYTLGAISSALAEVTSSSFNITGGTASKLVFTTQPANVASGASLGSVAVTVEDINGNVVTSSIASVTVAIANNAGPGGTLSGTLTVSAVNGVAILPGLSIDVNGTGYTLSATSGGLTSATSNAFNIGAGTANKLAFTTQPSNATSGSSLGSIAVTIEDASGNRVSSSTASVTLAIANNAGPGGVLSGTLTVNAVAGVATFPGLNINLDGTGYTLGATSAGLTSATSSAFNITSGTASQLVFTTQPSNAASGASLGSIAVTIEDAAGNKVSSSTASVTLAIANNAGPGGVLSGTLSVNAIAGVATFPGLSINLDGTGYTLGATSGSLTSATSNGFNISASGASQLVFTTQPANATSGSSLGSIAVTVEDASGNKISSSTASVTLAIANNAGPGGVLSGTLTVNAVAGVATFPGLSINLDGTGYTLSASSGSLSSATSSAFNITSGVASQLAFSTQPANAASGASLGSVAVTIEDAAGNKVSSSTASVTLAIANNAGPGGVLSGTLTVNAVAGVATLPGLSINVDGTGYTLSAASGSLTGATSSAFNITSATASKLVFTTQPASTTSGATLGSIAVSVEDSSGNVVTSSTASVTLAIANNAGPGGVLSGTLSVNAIAGVATFPGLSINLDGTGYTLSAASASLTGATSSAFNITSGAASKLVFTTQPSSAQSDSSLGSIVVKVEDADGNVVTSSSASIILAIGNNAGPGGVLAGTLTVSASSGVASFPGLSINIVGTGYTLTGTSSSLTTATSSAFNITPGAPSKLVFTTQPSSENSTVSLGSVTVQIEDVEGNVCTSSSDAITMAIGNNAGPGGTLSGTLSVNASSGVATFANLSIDKIGTGYTLIATDGAFNKTSSAFNITLGPPTQLAFTTQPTSSNIQAGTSILSDSSTPLQAALEDAGGNVETGSSLTVTIAIGSNPGGGTLHGTMSVNTSTGVASFGDLWIDMAASGYTLTASSGSANGTSSSFTIVPAPPTTFSLDVDGSGLMNGCAHGSVQTMDIYGNVSYVLSNMNFTLSSPSAHMSFFSDGGCSSSASFITLTTGSTWGDFWFRSSIYESTTVQVNQSTWAVTQTGPYFSETQLVITGPTTITTGACTAYTLNNEDALGTLVTTSTDIDANNGAYDDGDPFSPFGGMYGTDSTCTSGNQNLTLPSGSSSVVFYFMTPISQSINYTRYDATNYSGEGFGPIQVNGNAPTSVAITGPSVVTTNTCSPAFHVSLLDTYGNHTTSGSPVVVTMTTDGTTQAYSDPGCGTSLPSGHLTIAASNAYGTFYTKSSLSAEHTLTASGLGTNSFTLLSQATGATFVTSDGGGTRCVAINGKAKCAGSGSDGKLGNGATSDSIYPVQVSGLTSGVTQLATSFDASCAVTPSGVQCWGAGGSGELGGGSLSDSYTPQAVSVLGTSITQLVGGQNFFCAIQSGIVYCWGAGYAGQLGQGNTNDSDVPVEVPLPEAALSVSSGPNGSCAILVNGQLWCWGSGANVNLFVNYYTSFVPAQVVLPGIPSSISVGSYISVIISGQVYYWGYDQWSGNYVELDSGLPGNYTQVADSYDLSGYYALRSDGSVWCSVRNAPCGAGGSYDSEEAETDITSGAISINTENYGGACAVVTQAGQPNLECWGNSANINLSTSPQSDASVGALLIPFDTYSWN